MTPFPTKGLLFSPKALANCPPARESDPALGRSLFAHPARFTDLSKIARWPTAAPPISTTIPIASGHEDFAMLVEAKGATLGLGWLRYGRMRATSPSA